MMPGMVSVTVAAVLKVCPFHVNGKLLAQMVVSREILFSESTNRFRVLMVSHPVPGMVSVILAAVLKTYPYHVNGNWLAQMLAV